MAKKVEGYIKLQIPAGKATPAPPVGPALGQHGVNIVEFTKQFNARTADKGDVLIKIADNGVGMTKEQIEKIYEGKEDNKPVEGEHGGVGLKNVMGRLKLSFDREDVFVIESEGEGKGTVVTLRIPIEGEETDKEDNKEK